MVEPAPRDQGQVVALLMILTVIAVGAVLHLLSGVLIPLAVAFFLSYMAMPAVRWGKKAHIPVVISLIAVLLAFSAIVGGFGSVVYSSGAEFVDQLPELLGEARGSLKPALKFLKLPDEQIDSIILKDGSVDVQKLISHLPEQMPGLKRFASSGLDAIFTGMSFTTLVLLFMVFIVLDRGHEVLDRRIVAAFSREGTQSAAPILKEIHQKIERYIITKTGISLLTAILVTGTLMLFSVPYAGLLGVMTFLLNYIPSVGSILATIPAVLLAMATLPSPLHAVPVAISLGVIQFGVGNVLEPVILSKQLRLNPITILVALVLWGVLWGIWGMVLAVPIAAVIKIIVEHSTASHSLAALMDGD